MEHTCGPHKSRKHFFQHFFSMIRCFDSSCFKNVQTKMFVPYPIFGEKFENNLCVRPTNLDNHSFPTKMTTNTPPNTP
jgi:hypothetical protein